MAESKADRKERILTEIKNIGLDFTECCSTHYQLIEGDTTYNLWPTTGRLHKQVAKGRLIRIEGISEVINELRHYQRDKLAV